MATPFRITWRPTRGYWPTAPVTGEAADIIYRGQNLIVKGGQANVYCEQWKGYLQTEAAGSNVTLTGTVATTLGSATVTGTSTLLKKELIPGQLIILNGRVHAVLKIASNTSMTIDPVATANGSGLTVTFCKQIQEVDTFRASMIRGSIIKLSQDNFLGVGRGAVMLDGAAVPGGGWSLMDQPQLAVLDNGTGNYSIYKLGMKKPTAPTLGTSGSGTKNMQPGVYSIRIVPARMATGGFNNPSEATQVTINTAGDKIDVTFPAMDTAAGQDAWRVYGTLFSTSEGITGPWYYVDTVTTSAIASGGGTFSFEWRDAEIQSNDILEFDNDPPPPAPFIGSLGGIPVLIGTNGPGRQLSGTVATTSGNPTVTGTSTAFDTELAVGRLVWINNLLRRVVSIASATSMNVEPTPTATASGLTIRSADEAPGPVLRPAKPYLGGFNIEAFPARFAIALNPPETVIGFVEGMGRLYPMTANRLHVAMQSGDQGLPVVVRPFWKTGFRNPRACCFVNGTLYGFTTNGATRSPGMGDQVTEEHEFAVPVKADMENWNPARVTLAYDQKNEAVWFCHADDGQRPGATMRYSTVLMYMLQSGVWSAPIRIEDIDDLLDYRVTSGATVNGVLYFLSTSDTSSTINEWDVAGEIGEVWAATPYMDAGAPGFEKNVRGTRIVADGSNPITAAIFGAAANEDVPINDLIAGTNSASGNFTFPSAGNLRVSEREKLNVRRLQLFSARVSLSSGVVGQSRIDAMILDGNITRVQY